MHYGTDDRFTIWGQKVKGQGHGRIKYALSGMSGKVLVRFSPNLNQWCMVSRSQFKVVVEQHMLEPSLYRQRH